jgi:hypothetical protein
MPLGNVESCGFLRILWRNLWTHPKTPSTACALRAEKPATQMGQIRWAWPEISAALAHGHSLTTVHRRLNEVGIQIPYKRLSLYIGRLRREDAARRPPVPVTLASGPFLRVETSKVPDQPAPVPTSDANSVAGSPDRRDPLAKLRKYANTQPGFRWGTKHRRVKTSCSEFSSEKSSPTRPEMAPPFPWYSRR